MLGAVVVMVGSTLAASSLSARASDGAGVAVETPRYTYKMLVVPTYTRRIRISYRSHTGAIRAAFVLVPRSYRRGGARALPLVISPHGRGVSAQVSAGRWGNLPGVGQFAVVSPAGQGDRLQRYSWGARGQIEDLARMPEIVRKALPWLEIDGTRVYAVGGSMGGQETLLLAARHPELLAGAVAMDSLVDFRLQYRNFPRVACGPGCQRTWGGPIGNSLQRLARIEVGGTPESAPAAYSTRSPMRYARRLAGVCVPLQIWWSRKDRTVVDSSKQSGRLFHEIRRLNRRAPVAGYIGSWDHATALRAGRYLPYALTQLDLMPHEFDAKPDGPRLIPPLAETCSR